MWDLVLSLKGMGCTRQQLDEAFTLWWNDAKHVVGTKDEATSRKAFWRAYDRRNVPGVQDWRRFAEQAGEIALPPSIRYPSPKTEMLLRVCMLLQWRTTRPDNSFFLSQEDAGKAIGCSQRGAGDKLGYLIRDGHLIVTREGVQHESIRCATEYRCTVEPWGGTDEEGGMKKSAFWD